jgi:hypothetical protein
VVIVCCGFASSNGQRALFVRVKKKLATRAGREVAEIGFGIENHH